MIVFYKIPLLLLIGIIAAANQYLLKSGLNLGLAKVEGSPQRLADWLSILTQPRIIIAAGLYALAFGIYAYLISQLDVSKVYPLSIGFNFVLIGVVAWWLLGEPVGYIRILGMILIIAGMYLVAQF